MKLGWEATGSGVMCEGSSYKEDRISGNCLGPNRIEIEAEKVKGVLGWPEPKNVKDVRKFLGLTNYYRRFIKDFT